MWYYEFAHQPAGPVDTETIKQLLAGSSINAATLVWSEGMPGWLPLQQTQLASLIPADAPAVPPPLSQVNILPPHVNHPKLPALKALFTWWLILLGVSLVLLSLSFLFSPTSASIMPIYTFLQMLAEIPLIASSVLMFVLLYKFWQIIQDGYASTSPEKAIGYSFIPFFNFYWIFRLFIGLDHDFNRYIRVHFSQQADVSVRKAHPGIALAYLLTTFIGSFSLIVYFFSAIIRAALTQPFPPNFYTPAVIIPMLAFYVVIYGMMIFTFVDYYLTARSILKAEAQQ